MNKCVFYCALSGYLRVCDSLCESSYMWSIVCLRFWNFPYLFLCTFRQMSSCFRCYQSTSAVFTIFGLLQLHVDQINHQWIWNWTLCLIVLGFCPYFQWFPFSYSSIIAQSLKISNVGPGQHLDEWPFRNTVSCRLGSADGVMCNC